MRTLLFSLLIPAISFAQELNFSVEPLVTTVSKNSVELQWETSKDCDCSISYGRSASDLRSVSNLGRGREFKAPLSSLQPSELVYAKVSCAEAGKSIVSEVIPMMTASLSTGAIKVYFNHASDNSVSTGTNAVYLNKLIDDTLIAYINRATQSLDIAIYNASSSSSISDIASAINAAYNRGVKVRLVYEAGNTNSMLPNLNPGIKKLGNPQVAFGGLMHNKFVVIDAKHSDANKAYVWTGSTNWSVDQLNNDPNNVIIIQDKSLALAYRMEFEEMWGDTGLTPNSATSKFGSDKTNNTPHVFNIGGKTVESYFSPSDGVNSKLINTIGTANSDLEFASMIITRSDVASAINAKFMEGVYGVHGLVEDSGATTTWAALKATLGAQRMRSYNGISYIMHHKFMIVDALEPSSDPITWTGSHNWSTSADQYNDENTLIIHDATIANIYYQAFVKLFNNAGGVIGIETNAVAKPVYVFPNPAQDVLFIKTEINSTWQLSIFSLKGELLSEGRFAEAEGRIDLSTLPAGVYFGTVSASNEVPVKFRFVVSR